ncbi:MAG: cytochrome c, partial [Candidatus Dadabacteria bacterium]|nr:cytochrome c [Candidatus Dadabacteria bacterium]
MRTVYVVLLTVLCLSLGAAVSNAETKGDAAKGKTTFENTCAACHGPGGKGDGPAAAALDPKPKNLTDADLLSTQTDDFIYKVISEGGAAVGLSPMMAPWGGVLSEQDIWNVVAFIRQDLCKCQY